MNYVHCVVFSALVVAVFCQRSPYAGRNPIGYPILETTTTTADALGNRFGSSVPTEPLPIEALGDRDLVNRLAKLPVAQQPFWFINWKALDAQRKNQQTYEQRPNPFIDNSVWNGQNLNQNQGQTQNLQRTRRSQVRF